MRNGGKFAGLWSGLYRGTTDWSILSNGEWTVPVTGWYQIDLRGGGGGGGGGGGHHYNGAAYGNLQGGTGGHSRQVEDFFLQKNVTYTITLGAGGEASGTYNHSGKAGGSSSIGELLTVRGGGGGGGASAISNGSNGTSYGNATPATGEPGRGGIGSYPGYRSARPGEDGACYIKYLGQGYTA